MLALQLACTQVCSVVSLVELIIIALPNIEITVAKEPKSVDLEVAAIAYILRARSWFGRGPSHRAGSTSISGEGENRRRKIL
jgi:hypothetical protein